MTSNLDRALAYLQKCPPAVSGSGGHNATLRAACELYRFGLSESDAWQALQWFNQFRCQPIWSERELRHKLADAEQIVRGTGEVGMRGPARHGKRRGFQPPQWAPVVTTPKPSRAVGRPIRPVAADMSADIPVPIPDEWPAVIEAGAWVGAEPPAWELLWCGAHRDETSHWFNRAGQSVCGECHPPAYVFAPNEEAT